MEETKKWNQIEFGNRIFELRTKLKLNQTDFGKKVGFSAQTISMYERGEKNPQIDSVVKIALAFNVSLDWLCDIEKKTDTGMKQTIENDEDALKTILQLANYYKDSFRVEGNCFRINEPYVDEFFSNFGEMKSLLDRGIIKNDIFNTWTNGRIKEIVEKYSEPMEIKADELPF